MGNKIVPASGTGSEFKEKRHTKEIEGSEETPRFGILEAIQKLEAEPDAFIWSFNHYKDTDEFLEISQSNLTTIVSSEDLPLSEMNIFECVRRWAEFQCTLKGIEKSGRNMRDVLGAVLFEIRFPRMSLTEFSKICQLHIHLFSQLEQLAICSLIGMKDQEKQNYGGGQFPFKTHARKQPKKIFHGSTLCLTKNQNIVDSPPFVCNGDFNSNEFRISGGRIELHGIGFFGPIDEDSYFDVTVQITRRNNYSVAYDSGKKKKRIFARKRKIFHFTFDEPISIEQSEDKIWNNWDNFYYIVFWLKGPNTMAVDRNHGCEEAVEETGVKFRFCWWNGRQVAELLYKKL